MLCTHWNKKSLVVFLRGMLAEIAGGMGSIHVENWICLIIGVLVFVEILFNVSTDILI